MRPTPRLLLGVLAVVSCVALVTPATAAAATGSPPTTLPIPTTTPGPTAGSLVVSWRKSDFDNASVFRIDVAIGANRHVIASGRVRGVTSASFRGLDPRITYQVLVTSSGGAAPVKSAWGSARARGVPTPAAVSARAGLMAVIIRWLPIASATAYHLNRNGASLVGLAPSRWCTAGVCTYIDRQVHAGQTYTYDVSARGPDHSLPAPGPSWSRASESVSAQPNVPQARLTSIGHYAVHSRWITLWRGDRALPTLLITPSVSAATPVPLVVFAHGWNNDPDGYASLLAALASSGVVVAAPVSPGMAAGYDLYPVAQADAAQVADLRSAVTQLLTLNLGLPIDRSAIIEAGQSRGALSVATTAFNPDHHDARVRAFVELSVLDGSLDAATNSSYAGDNTAPMLFAGSYGDEYGLWPDSRRLFSSTRGVAALLGIGRGESHLSPWDESTPFHTAIWQGIVDFCRWSVANDTAARERLISDTAIPGLNLTLQD